MHVFTVDVREKAGTGSARKERNKGYVPGVLYGGGLDPVKITIPLKEVNKSYFSGKMTTSIALLEYKGERQKILPRNVQIHPLTGQPIHVEFYRINEDKIIQVEVGVHFVNTEISKGIKRGGVLNIVKHEIEVSVPAGSIPDHFEADIKDLEIGDVVHVSDIKMPENCKPVIDDRDFTIATIAAPVKDISDEVAEDVAPDADEEGEESEEGEDKE